MSCTNTTISLFRTSALSLAKSRLHPDACSVILCSKIIRQVCYSKNLFWIWTM